MPAKQATKRAVPKGYGTRAEVAEYTGFSVQTLANYKSQGKGPPCTGKGRNLRYQWAEVEAWMSDPNRT